MKVGQTYGAFISHNIINTLRGKKVLQFLEAFKTNLYSIPLIYSLQFDRLTHYLVQTTQLYFPNLRVFGLPLECGCAGALASLTAHDVQVNKRGMVTISRIQTLFSSLCCRLYTLWCSAVPSGRETPPMTHDNSSLRAITTHCVI